VNSWKVILATMVIFGTGVVTGGLLVHYSEGIRVPHPGHASGISRQAQLPNPGVLRFEFLRRAGRDLELTTDQRERLDKIIKESQERARRVTAPFLREEVQRTKTEFREVLTPEQRTKFDDLLKQQQQQQQQRAREQRHPQAPGERPPEAAPAEPKQ
jgi:hypothetical protein